MAPMCVLRTLDERIPQGKEFARLGRQVVKRKAVQETTDKHLKHYVLNYRIFHGICLNFSMLY